MIRLAIGALAAAACSTARIPDRGDGGVADASPDGTTDAPGDAGPAYRHTIAIDGADDFTAGERFATTSASYAARVTYDADQLYIGYSGADIDPGAPAAATKWLFVYLDLDPGAATGARQSEPYRTQHATFPAGFGAEYYVRRKSDGTYTKLDRYAAGAWATTTTAITESRLGTFVELAIPRAVLNTGTKLGVTLWMINEQDGLESTYGGLYDTAFTDGYGPALAIGTYLRVDFTSPRAPNDPANQVP